MHTVVPCARRLTVAATATVIATVAALSLSACGASSGNQPTAVVSAMSGSSADANTVPLTPAFAKPDLVLTDEAGQSYDLVKQTAGKPTLVYFGYTHCPDVCPTTMADIAAAKRRLPAAEQKQLKVVFVSTDPTRDTPSRLKAWLGAFDPTFIGLTGSFTTIQKAAFGLGVDIEPPVKQADGSYTVSHGAEVFVFSPKDNEAHYFYTSGTPEPQYAADLPKIIAGVTP